jgi:hypothetical protein
VGQNPENPGFYLALSARNPKDNGVCMLRGVLLRVKWRLLTSAIFGEKIEG